MRYILYILYHIQKVLSSKIVHIFQIIFVSAFQIFKILEKVIGDKIIRENM